MRKLIFVLGWLGCAATFFLLNAGYRLHAAGRRAAARPTAPAPAAGQPSPFELQMKGLRDHHLAGVGSIPVEFTAIHRTTIHSSRFQIALLVRPMGQEEVVLEHLFEPYEMGLHAEK